MYWLSTPAETRVLLEAIGEREAARDKSTWYRAGMIAAEVRNTLRSKPTQKVYTAEDFLPPAYRPEKKLEEVSPDAFVAAFRGFAATHNRRVRA